MKPLNLSLPVQANRVFMTVGGLLLALVLGACAGDTTSPNQSAQAAAQAKAAGHSPYVPVNDVEFNNYNMRMKISDDPTTILWCTSAFPIPSSPLFTVPVVGKLTSSSKRPYSTSTVDTTTGNTYSPELPGPDGMYGTSTDYRYGFTPAGVYVDFYNMQTFCTTEPTVWQRQNTTIVLGQDSGLSLAQTAAQVELAAAIKADKAGDTAGAAAHRLKAEQLLQAALAGK